MKPNKTIEFLNTVVLPNLNKRCAFSRINATSASNFKTAPLKQGPSRFRWDLGSAGRVATKGQLWMGLWVALSVFCGCAEPSKTTKPTNSKASDSLERPCPQGQQRDVAEQRCVPIPHQSPPRSSDQGDIAQFERDCTAGKGLACFFLGMHHVEGQDAPQDSKRAAVLFEKACSTKFAPACFQLGVLYSEGVGVEQSWKRARTLWDKACEMGDPQACFNLGLVYAEGEGLAPDLAQTKRLWEAACQRGLVPACFNLGVMYSTGRGVPQDLDRAEALWRRACQAGLAQACEELKVFDEAP